MNIRRPKWNWRGALGKRNGDPPYIIPHNTGGDSSPEAIHDYHRNRLGWRGIGYHEHIADNGDVTIGRPAWAMGGHCHGWNHCYGIAAGGNYNKRKSMPDAQYDALLQRVYTAQKRWPKAKIKGHGEMPHNITSCPGDNFPLEQLKRDVANMLRPSRVAIRDRGRLKVKMRDFVRAHNAAHLNDKITIPRGFGWRLPNFGKPARTLAWRITTRLAKTRHDVPRSQWPTVELAAALGMKKYQE